MARDAWIDPDLLQLVALGTAGDPYLRDGRHLRWFMAPMLGFPRTGFYLRRRRALKDDWQPEVLQAQGLLREQDMTEAGVLTGTIFGPERVQFPAKGLELLTPGGRTFISVPALTYADALELSAKAEPVVLEVGPPLPLPQPGPLARDPAAYLELVIVRHETVGSVQATAYFDGTGARGLVHRAALEPSPTGADRWVRETLLLHGGLIERVEVSGEEAGLEVARWVPTRSYADADGWDDLDLFYLPITDAPHLYPQWTSLSGAAIAEQRLLSWQHRALPPWHEPAHPPPPASPEEILNELKHRYLGETFIEAEIGLRTFLEAEVTGLIPQALAEEGEAMMSSEHPDFPATVTQRPFQTLYSAAVDPHWARMLGLMTSDEEQLGAGFDYLVEADFPSIWLQYAVSPTTAEARLKPWRALGMPLTFNQDGTPTRDWEELLGGRRCLSMVTAVSAEPAVLPLPPAGFDAVPLAAPGHRPVPVKVQLGWAAPSGSMLTDPRDHRVFHVLRRETGGTSTVLNRIDEDLDVFLPIVPTREAQSGGRNAYLDWSMPGYGSYTYKLSGMDLWGRFSPWAVSTVPVRDLVPPPAPAKVQAELQGAPEKAPDWDAARITFEWPEHLVAMAPDLKLLRVHMRQGRLNTQAGSQPVNWGRFEHQPDSEALPLEVAWPPVPGPLAAPPEISASLEVEPLAGGGYRLAVTAAPIRKAFVDGFAHLSATLTAVDEAGNESSPAVHAVATRVDPAAPPPPPQPPELQWASLPDAELRSWYTVSLSTPPGTYAEVVRAAQVSLLLAGGTDDVVWQAMDEPARVAHLKQLALAHPQAFKLDTETPLDHLVTSHRVQLPGYDRGWTVIMVRPTSRTAATAPWPTSTDAFAVVAVPRLTPLQMPHVTSLRPLDSTVELRIAADLSGVTRSLRVYRTRYPERAGDIRRMRPVARVALPLPAPGSDPEAVVLVDETAQPYRRYIYRVVAEGEGGLRSMPTPPVAVETRTPAPPEPGQIPEVELWGRTVFLHLRLQRPDYAVELLRRREESVTWQVVGDGPLDLSVLEAARTADGFDYLYRDEIPSEFGGSRLFYRLRVRDPGGRHTLGPARSWE